MNFKEIYKSANDNIKGDRALIDNVYKKAQRKQRNFFAPSFAAAVALFALVLYPSINTHHTDRTAETKIAKIYDSRLNEKSEPPEKKLAESEIPTQSEKKTDTMQPKEEQNSNDTPQAQAAAENSVPVQTEVTAENSPAEDVAVLSETTEEFAVSGADTFSAKLASDSSAPIQSGSITAYALLPSDMSFESPVSRQKNVAALSADEHLLAKSCENEDRYIEIFPTNSVVCADGGNSSEYIAHFTYDGTDYTLIAKNVTVAEIDALLKSLK